MKDFSTEKLPFIPPEHLFCHLKDKACFAWLDTSLPGRGKYSLIAFDPFLVFKSRKDKICICEGGNEKVFTGKPLEVLNDLLARYRMSGLPGFFAPGALGYFSYDLGRQIEKLPDNALDDLNIPEICLGFYDSIILCDHDKRSLEVISCRLDGKETSRDFNRRIKGRIREIRRLCEAESGSVLLQRAESEPLTIKRLHSNMSYERYVKSVHKIKDYIASGDVYQINFARRIEIEGRFSPEAVYARLRKVNPTMFSAYFNTGEFQLLSNSPEIFLKKTGNELMTKPMKGTRPRGETSEQDRAYRRELTVSEKDKAELVMIVDLERNDIGRVCRFGSVRVRKLRQVEAYRTVFQTTAVVEGVLNDGITPVDIIRATFPGGSITGAPKIRAMEIIDELEPHKRAFYTGSMGYLGFNGDMELNIMIRTVLLLQEKLYYPVGGGIVWDSTPEGEYEETVTKAGALFLALGCDYGKEILSS